jgi:hypothetical protein
MGGSINSLHILRFEGASTIHFHNKFCGFHSFFSCFQYTPNEFGEERT